ncbi:MAG: transketolase family protein, partial [Candidatus Omnitrophica bacterium]|nr:transketolase family protein [Candidatus Omnitrophota bacterium]
LFATGRAWDQVRNSICYNNFNVKIVASHAGITVGEDGATHQAIEDIAIMRCIPNMKIIVPCDGPETREAVIAAAEKEGPVYIRLGRAKFPTIENKGKFEIGKVYALCEGENLTIVACGIMVNMALIAAEILRKEDIKVTVLNMHTIKPLDTDTLLKYAQRTKRFIVCEEHMVAGGLGSAVAEFLSENYPIPVLRVGIQNCFGQSGSPDDLLKEYGLTSQDIVCKARKIFAK